MSSIPASRLYFVLFGSNKYLVFVPSMAQESMCVLPEDFDKSTCLLTLWLEAGCSPTTYIGFFCVESAEMPAILMPTDIRLIGLASTMEFYLHLTIQVGAVLLERVGLLYHSVKRRHQEV